MNLKDKTISGITWNLFDSVGKSLILLGVGIVLGRLIEPSKFGIISVTGVFISILSFFSDGGFGSALIQKKDCNDSDYNSVFIFNVVVAVMIYFLLFFASPFIATFFQIPELDLILKVLSFQIIINSFGIIQIIILTKNLNFKLLTKISLFSQITSGILAVIMALNGFGVWSLVIRTIFESSLYVIVIYLFNSWKPKLVFDYIALKKLAKFGFNVLFSGLIDNIFNSSYYFIIGKSYSVTQLGFFTRADSFSKLPSQNLSSVIQRVSFPALSQIQDNNEALKQAFKKLVTLSMFISSLLMFNMAASSHAMILMFLGDAWAETTFYLQLLCFTVFFYPLYTLNLNVLNIKGFSSRFLRLEIIKKILMIPVVLIGILISIKAMLYSMIVYSFIILVVNTIYSNRLINYSLMMQLRDVLPGLIFSSFVSSVVFLVEKYIPIKSNVLMFFIQFSAGILLTITLGEFLKFEPYVELKKIFKQKFLNKFIAIKI